MNCYTVEITIDGRIWITDNHCDWRDPAWEGHLECAHQRVWLPVYAESEERAKELAKAWKGYETCDDCWLAELEDAEITGIELVEKDCEDVCTEGYDEANVSYEREPY